MHLERSGLNDYNKGIMLPDYDSNYDDDNR